MSQNQNMEMPRISKQMSSWADLPLDIQVLILGKLNPVDIKLNLADIIWFRATCKNWHVPKDRIFDRLDIPGLCKLSWSRVERGHLECMLYDPYSRRTFKTWKFVENLGGTKRLPYDIQKYGSKLVWLIAGYKQRRKYPMFMYHPYSKKFIWLPSTIRGYRPFLATLSGNPGSQDCQVFVFCDNVRNVDNSYICSYCLNEDSHWRIETDFKKQYIRGFEYTNGQIFCLFVGGITGRYSLADRSWVLLDRLKLGNRNSRLWLTKGECDLLVAIAADRDTRKYSTFYFDWSNTSWVQSDLPESSAIFITRDLVTYARDDRVNTASCNLHFFYYSDRFWFRTREPSHYSFAGGNLMKLDAMILSSLLVLTRH